MSHTPHELHADFPQFEAKLSELKQTDAHFAKLADAYHNLNREIHRAETNIEPMEELTEVQKRKERAALKDQIYAILSK